MKTMTAREAKTHFGEFLDIMQREPVLVTKNNRPVGIMISIEDAADSLLPELHMEKEVGYDDWLKSKIESVRNNLRKDTKQVGEHDEVMDRVWNRIQNEAGLKNRIQLASNSAA